MNIGYILIKIFAKNDSKTSIFDAKIRRFVAPLYLYYIYIVLNIRYFSPKDKEFNNIRTIRIELLILIIFARNNSKTSIFDIKIRRFIAPLHLYYIYIILNTRYFSSKNNEFNNIKIIRIELLIIIIFAKNNLNNNFSSLNLKILNNYLLIDIIYRFLEFFL